MRPLFQLRRTIAETLNVILSTLRLRSKEQALDEEIQFHLDARIEELIRSGHSSKQARLQARKEFGNIDRCREECRDSWGNRAVTNSIQDLKFSFRSLKRSTAYSLTVIGTIALCIACHTVSFTALYNLFLEPPPFRDSEQLVEIYNTLPLISQPKHPASIHQYLMFREQADTFEELALWFTWTFNIGEDSTATRGIGAQVTASYSRLLDIDPLLGNFFTDEDCEQGNIDRVVLTQTCWENRYGSDPDIVGKQIQLSGTYVTVVAVAPRKLEALNADTVMLRPYAWSEQEASEQQHFRFRPTLYGRLNKDASIQQGATQLNSIENNYIASTPNSAVMQRRQREAGFEVAVGSIRTEQTKGVQDALLLLQSAAVLVLALGCANISNLSTNRFNARGAELSVRLSLGATRYRLAKQLLVESLLLAIPGVAIGILLSTTSFTYLNLIISELVREAQPIAIDSAVILSALMIVGIIVFVSNLSPLRQISKLKRCSIGQSQSRLSTSGAQSRYFSNFLVVTQFTIAVVVLIGASLLLRSFQKTMENDPGFDPTQIVYFRTARNLAETDAENWPAIETQILEKLRSIPGIESVSYSSYNPVNPRLGTNTFPLRGEDNSDLSQVPRVHIVGVSPEYFQTMGIPILAGRAFEASDYEGDLYQRYIMDDNFIRRYFPGEDLVGRIVDFGARDAPPESARTIVGIAKTVNIKGFDDSDSLPVVYYLQPKAQPGLSLEMRTELSTRTALSLARKALSEIDPTLPMYHQGSLQDFFDDALAPRTALTSFVSLFASIAITLAAIGTYGSLSYDVTQRVREIGIRKAIGASQRAIVSQFLRQGLLKALIGVAIGIAIAFPLAGYTRMFLFEIEPTDPLSFLATPTVLLAIAALASWIPTRRAAKTSPVESLRAE